MRIARVVLPTVMLAALAAVPGCGVQQTKYDSLLSANRSLQEENVRLADELEGCRTTSTAMRMELNQASGKFNSLDSRNATLQSEVDKWANDYTNLLTRVSSLEVGPLPPDVELALQQLTQDYPQLLGFDAKRGKLQFASDFTFALGSAELRTEATATIEQLAQILNGDNASILEVMVVGHTDNVPIGKPETRQKHPTNLHLSVHRSIAVENALRNAGIDPVRIIVAGCGPYRPIVANGRNGAASNRRVEIYLAPMPQNVAAGTPVTGQASPASAQPRQTGSVDPQK